MSSVALRAAGRFFSFFERMDGIISRQINKALLFIFNGASTDTGGTDAARALDRIACMFDKNPLLYPALAAAVTCILRVVSAECALSFLLISVFVISIIRPYSAICLLFFFIATDTASLFGTSTTIYSNEAILLLLTAGAFINAALRGIKTKPVYPGIFLVFLCMIFYALPVLYMPYKTAIIKGLIKNMEIIFYFFYIVLFFRSASEVRAALLFIASGILIVFTTAAYGFYFDRESLDFLIGPAGRLICRIDAGMGLTVFPAYLNIILPASFISMFMFPKNRVVFALLFIFCALTIASVIALPLSRAGWIVLVADIMFMIFFLSKKSGKNKSGARSAFFYVLSGIIISMLLLYAVHGKYALENVIFRATSSMDENESSYQSAMSRIKYFKIGLKMLRQYPMGIGPGSYKQIVWKYTADKDLDPAYLHHLHNLVLQIAVESGILGLLSMAMLALYLFFACARVCRVAKLSFGKLLSLAAAASFLALILSGLFDMPLVYSRGIFAVFIPALFASHMASSVKKQD